MSYKSSLTPPPPGPSLHAASLSASLESISVDGFEFLGVLGFLASSCGTWVFRVLGFLASNCGTLARGRGVLTALRLGPASDALLSAQRHVVNLPVFLVRVRCCSTLAVRQCSTVLQGDGAVRLGPATPIRRCGVWSSACDVQLTARAVPGGGSANTAISVAETTQPRFEALLVQLLRILISFGVLTFSNGPLLPGSANPLPQDDNKLPNPVVRFMTKKQVA